MSDVRGVMSTRLKLRLMAKKNIKKSKAKQ